MLLFGSSTLKIGGGGHGEGSTANTNAPPHLLPEWAAGSLKNWIFSNILMN